MNWHGANWSGPGAQRVLIDAVDAAEVAAAVADADAGTTAGADGKPKPLSEKKAAERRHVTLMDWGEWPAVLITVRPPHTFQ